MRPSGADSRDWSTIGAKKPALNAPSDFASRSRCMIANPLLTATPPNSSTQVEARDVEKAGGPFACPECRAGVILRKGRIRVHHFAHKPPVNCTYGTGETEEHRRAKREIADALRGAPMCCAVVIEKSIRGLVRPDVFTQIGRYRIAIEVQLSCLTEHEILRRTRCYEQLGIYVLWLLPSAAPRDSQRYAPRAWEKFVHGLCFGRLHYWLGDASIMPVHFGEYQLYVEESEWYESDGTHRQEGGYDRYSKKWRTPVAGARTSIVACRPIRRKAWRHYPPARLWQSRQDAWRQVAEWVREQGLKVIVSGAR